MQPRRIGLRLAWFLFNRCAMSFEREREAIVLNKEYFEN